MKKRILILILSFHKISFGQLDSNTFMRVPNISDANMLSTTTGFSAGNVIFNTNKNSLFLFNGTTWVRLAEETKKNCIQSRGFRVK